MENALVGTILLLVIGIPLSALIRAIAAGCSQQVRESISRHPIVHAIWFGSAIVVVLLVLFAPLYMHHGQKKNEIRTEER